MAKAAKRGKKRFKIMLFIRYMAGVIENGMLNGALNKLLQSLIAPLPDQNRYYLIFWD